MAPVTFALAGERLVTLRYHDPRPFRTYPAHAEHMPSGCASAHAVLFGLLEEIVDRLADLLERAAEEIDGISRAVFSRRAPGAREAQDFRAILERIGAKGDLLSNIRYSLLTLERMLGFLSQLTMERAKGEKMLRAHAKSLARDTRSLVDHAGYLTQKVTFLLDATLGMISTEQNQIIKIFSVMAVAFLPPTLVASIYGMNFEAMPELGWPYGYPLALGAMVLSALLPLWYFRRRGWL
jgi:magnesium transporter